MRHGDARNQQIFWNCNSDVRERSAPPHFHAIYQRHKAMIEIETGLMKGDLPPRVQGFVEEWRMLHLQDLRDNWKRGNMENKFQKIKPLE